MALTKIEKSRGNVQLNLVDETDLAKDTRHGTIASDKIYEFPKENMCFRTSF